MKMVSLVAKNGPVGSKGLKLLKAQVADRRLKNAYLGANLTHSCRAWVNQTKIRQLALTDFYWLDL